MMTSLISTSLSQPLNWPVGSIYPRSYRVWDQTVYLEDSWLRLGSKCYHGIQINLKNLCYFNVFFGGLDLFILVPYFIISVA